MISLILLLTLAVCAVGSVLYGLYGIARLDGDSQAQNGAIVMGVGGLLFIASGSTLMFPAAATMAAGALMSMNVVSAAWLGGEDSGDPPESPVVGWILMIVSFPILAIGSFPFWMNVVLLVMGGNIQPVTVIFGLGALMLGGWLFIMGFEKSGLYAGHAALRGGMFAAALLCASWFAVFIGKDLALIALGNLKQMSGAAPAGPLRSN